MNFLEACHTLMKARIAFSVHYVGEEDWMPVVTVNESVNNDQLRVLTNLGANMMPNGIFHILTQQG